MFLPFAVIRDKPSRIPTRRGSYLLPLISPPPSSVSTFKLANLMSCTLCFRPPLTHSHTHSHTPRQLSFGVGAVKLVCHMAHVRGRCGRGTGGIRLTRVTREHIFGYSSRVSRECGSRVLEKDSLSLGSCNDERDSQKYRPGPQ